MSASTRVDSSRVDVSRVYAEVNARKGRAWYDYKKVKIEWSSPDRYEIVARLGGGRYSEVFEGVDTVHLDRIVIKILKPVAAHKIKREIKVLRNLTSAPYCIGLLDVVRDPGRKYHSIVTEFVQSTPWSEIYTRFTPLDIRTYLFQLLTALDFIHASGIIHRDVKPLNIMWNHEKRELRLIDFGLAEFYLPDEELNVRVASRHFKGPELLVNYKRYCYSLDIWSTGCILASAIFRKHPFFRGSDNDDQLLRILRVLGTEKFDAYLKAYDISFECESDDLLANYPACPWTRFVTSETQSLATPDALDLLDHLLRFEPRERLTAKEALAHEYFSTVRIEGGKPDPALSDSGFASM
ncbi:Protein kinase domain-containing protein [Mycena kentingensis (nom. inval.)]|nr:Protein kinase domain-containing protein [Mycena kentingensis (nom. inval.)]